MKAFVSNHNISIKDIRVELNRVFPHGELDTISDVRTAVKIIGLILYSTCNVCDNNFSMSGRNQISSADIHALVKYLDAGNLVFLFNIGVV